MRVRFALLLVVLAAGSAQARPEPMHDLAGLIAQSEAVVVADKVMDLVDDRVRFRVTRVLRAVRDVPPTVDISLGGYAIDRDVEKRTVLFLIWDSQGPRVVP